MEYNPKIIEKKWQKIWEKNKTFSAKSSSKKKKDYILIEFPYPSGEGLHTGHVRSYTALDVVARKHRADGKNVLYPIGWDAFGLPTENYAVKTGIQPKVVTKKNTDNYRRQLKSLGFSFDWDREINTSHPEYYKWTQWIFLQLFKAGLAYKKKTLINWCPSCKIGLANEEVMDDKCERCGAVVTQKERDQWLLAITKYADRLDKDLDDVNFLERIKIQQRNWIGRSEGVNVKFPIVNSKSQTNIEVFTTRIDTIDGVTFLALAPQHLHAKEVTKATKAINPYNGEEIPVFVAEYVLIDYGTGAVMGVPSRDERDLVFAKANNLSIVERPLVQVSEAVKKTKGKEITSYKLRDWIFSRQRYWGEPIPMIHCFACALKNGQGWVPVPEKDLPVVLPPVKDFKPTEDGSSPLAKAVKWRQVKCPKCGGKAERETDVMPNWAGSSWYYWAYLIAQNLKSTPRETSGQEVSKLINSVKLQTILKNWLPVDWYNGGMEHTTLHLLYSRFWHKFLYDRGVFSAKEPYAKRTSHGFILAGGGEKMSKSKGNVVNPDEIVKNYGADTLRVYEMFVGPFDQSVVWSTESLMGARRFLDKVWRLKEKIKHNVLKVGRNKTKLQATNYTPHSIFQTLIHQTIKKVGEDIEQTKFNTAISQLMILLNEMEKAQNLELEDYKILLRLLNPFAPHITEEIWNLLGNKKSLSFEPWPKYEERVLKEKNIKIAIQINGKVRDVLMVKSGVTENEIFRLAKSTPKIAQLIQRKAIKKSFYVKERVVNFVV